MCGITGFKKFSYQGDLSESLNRATAQLRQRGPDHLATYLDKSVGLGHTRLSIIDTSSKAHQPMTDPSGRYTLVFNGEIYNYRELREGIKENFISTSDTEVLLYLLMNEGEDCLKKLNGFFAFAFYDNRTEELLLARDRMGIKPLHYYQSDAFFAFGSEMKALLSYPIPRTIDQIGLYWYLRLTYLPRDLSMIQGIKKLLPGHYMKVKNNEMTIQAFWSLTPTDSFTGNYSEAKKQTIHVMEQAVERRMVADVPLGSFLSGGTDSSVVASLASKFNPHLHTFSIGYQDHPFFDETGYAELVASQFNTNHTTFKLTNDDLLNGVKDIVGYLDEPFADSSALPTYILSQKVSESMKVALSGDGADELFGGYYKHLAFQQSLHQSATNSLIKYAKELLALFPQSRSSKLGNLTRRMSKYAALLKMSAPERYWRLASFNPTPNPLLLHPISDSEVNSFVSDLQSCQHFGLNAFLDLDLQVVLPGDMLNKVDLMSMANGLEVRVPFLDMEVVAFARSLPTDFKVKGNQRKRVLQDAFATILPKALHHRPKKGFEVPLLHWLRNELYSEIDAIVFNEAHLEDQQLFHIGSVMKLKKQLFSNNPGDAPTVIWSLYVFQKWYKNYFQ